MSFQRQGQPQTRPKIMHRLHIGSCGKRRILERGRQPPKISGGRRPSCYSSPRICTRRKSNAQRQTISTMVLQRSTFHPPVLFSMLTSPSQFHSLTRRYYFASTRNQKDEDAERRLQQWSKERLANTTASSQMKDILHDIALRLDRQSHMLQTIETWIQEKASSTTTNTRSSGSVVLEGILKSLTSLQRLHQDTSQTCHSFVQHLPDGGDSLTPLQAQQVGQACKEIYARHSLTIESMAELVIDARTSILHQTKPRDEDNDDDEEELQGLVLPFLQSRLVTQLLCDHVTDCMLHVHRKPHGAISVNVSVQDLVQASVTEARHLVEASLMPILDSSRNHHHEEDDDDPLVLRQAQEPPEPPQVMIEEQNEGKSIQATLVRPWLQYALVELLKNSLAITMERNLCYEEKKRQDTDDDEDDDSSLSSAPYLPIHIHISEIKDSIIIRLDDQGGGFPPSLANNSNDADNKSSPKLFEFAATHHKWDRMDDQQTYAMVRSPIRGLGVGLALSRLHLRQFGGDLTLEHRPATDDSFEGVTATLRLSKNFDTLEAPLSEKVAR